MPQGSFRKIQKTGGTTYIVSLPKAWVEARLKKGDSVRITQQGDDLIVSAQAVEKKRESATLDFRDGVTDVTRQVIAHYLSGFDTFVVNAPAAHHALIKKTVTEKVPGLEVLQETPQSLTFQNLLSHTDVSFGATFSRLIFLNQTLLDRLGEKIQGKNGPGVELLEREVDRFFILAFRQLASEGSRDAALHGQALHYVIAIKSLEKIADHAYIFTKRWPKKISKPEQKKFQRQCETAKAAYEKSTQALVKKDAKLSSGALEFIDGHRGGFDANDFLSYNLLKILDYSADVAEMALDLTSGK